MFIGIDVGGTNIRGGIISKQGEIILKCSVPTNAGENNKHVINNIIYMIKKLVKEVDYEIKGIGVGIPGTFIKGKGIVDFACNINFRNVHLSEEINKVVDIPVFINNDSNCAALGESYSGGAKGYSSSVMITIGTGIGAGIIFNNRIYDGFNSAAGELGHMVIVKDGILCTCGRRGCFERYASTSALVYQAKEALANEGRSLISEIVGNKFENINGEVIFKAAKMNDSIALKVVNNYMDYLSEGLANIINIIEPEAVIIGGGISGQGDFLISPVKERTYRLIYSKTLPKTAIKAAELGSDAGIIGAGMLCVNNG